MHKLLLVFVMVLAGCGSSSDTGPGGSPDGGGGGGGDGGADGGSVICSGTNQSVVSQLTRPRMVVPSVAYDGSSTMAIWSIYPGAGFLKSVWAQIKGGAVIAKGDFDFTSDVSGSQLFTFKSKFYLFHPVAKVLYAFNGTTWAAVSNFTGINAIAVSGSQLLGIGGSNGTSAVLFDGTTASAAQKISNFAWGAVASDGTGFGAVTIEPNGTGKVILHYLSYNGSAWSAESTIGNATIPGGASMNALSLAYSAGLWCLTAYGYIGSPPTAWILSGGTWTSSVLSSKGSAALFAGQSTFAVTTGDGAVNIYKGGSWTATQLSTGPFSSGYLAVYGSGYVYVGLDMSNPPTVTFFDGTSWGSPITLDKNLRGSGPLVVAGTTIAMGFGTQVVMYEGGAFSAPYTVSQSLATNAGGMTLAIEGSDVVAVYPEPGTMISRSRTAGTWGQPLTLPTSPTSGPVSEAALARAGNGHALAAWVQWDAGATLAFAAEYDGCKWGAPVALTGVYPQSLSVAANDTTFLINSPSGANRVFRWTGGGIAAPQSLGSSDLTISSDGTTFVAAWSQSGNIMSATSRDGQTWTAAQQVEAGPGWAIAPLTGGPAGVLAYSYNSGRTPNVSARVWTAGAWSAAVALTGYSTAGGVLGLLCQSAVADQSALLVCNSSSNSSDSELFASGAWSKVPNSGFLAGFKLGSDGTDYRLDHGAGSANSAILHAGAWSSNITNPILNIYLATCVAGKAGAWTTIGLTAPTGNIVAARASGAAPYDAAAETTLSPVGGVIASFSRWPGSTDALWLGMTPTLPGTPVLFVSLNL